MKRDIYADHAATTAISEAAAVAMMPYLSSEYGNPSTLYKLARTPRKAIQAARKEIASIIGASQDELFFTSCGTEADNWALTGVAFRYPNQRKRIITTCIEHHAVLQTCKFLERMGYDVVYLPVDRYGVVNPITLQNAITDDTILVSIMAANNEIGTIEPIKELASIAHAHGILFHTDAVQAVGHIHTNVQDLGIDLLSASAHKFNGPKGVGFLFVRRGTEIEPFLHGGGQEAGMRSGTENVAGIVGMAAALAEHVESIDKDAVYLETLRKQLIYMLHSSDIDFLINGHENHIPGSLSISLKGIEGETLLHRLDLMGISIATGSACNSQETVLSHVIRAIGTPTAYANGTIRITLGMDNNQEQINQITEAICKILK